MNYFFEPNLVIDDNQTQIINGEIVKLSINGKEVSLANSVTPAASVLYAGTFTNVLDETDTISVYADADNAADITQVYIVGEGSLVAIEVVKTEDDEFEYDGHAYEFTLD